MPYMNR